MNLTHNYLSIPLPNTWEDASQVIALGPEQGGFRVNLVVSQEPAAFGETSADFAERQKPALNAALQNYAVVEEGEKQFGLNTGFLRHHTFTLEKGRIGQLQFYCVLNGRCYTFTFTHLQELLPSAMPIAEGLFAGMRLDPPLFSPPEDPF